MLDIIYTILPYVIGILAGVFGSYFAIFKGKTKEVKEFIDKVVEALEDNKITKTEIEEIVKEFRDIIS